MNLKFPRAMTWPIGGEDFIIDTILLKRTRKALRDGGAPDMHESEIEGVLLAAEKAAATFSEIGWPESPSGGKEP